jgi:hypothetical protein
VGSNQSFERAEARNVPGATTSGLSARKALDTRLDVAAARTRRPDNRCRSARGTPDWSAGFLRRREDDLVRDAPQRFDRAHGDHVLAGPGARMVLGSPAWLSSPPKPRCRRKHTRSAARRSLRAAHREPRHRNWPRRWCTERRCTPSCCSRGQIGPPAGDVAVRRRRLLQVRVEINGPVMRSTGSANNEAAGHARKSAPGSPSPGMLTAADIELNRRWCRRRGCRAHRGRRGRRRISVTRPLRSGWWSRLPSR